MSAIVVLPILVPATMAAWPVVVAAAATAASTLGFAMATSEAKAGVKASQATAATEVSVDVESCEEITQAVALGDSLVFTKDDVTITVFRNNRNGVSVKVHSHQHSKQQLKALANEMIGKINQQYAYNRIVTELKQRNFNLVDQEVDEDGTVRLKVRIYQ
jgi:hypothetical protein